MHPDGPNQPNMQHYNVTTRLFSWSYTNVPIISYSLTCTSTERPAARKAPQTVTRNVSTAADGPRRRTAGDAAAVDAGSSAAGRRTARNGDRRR